MSNNSNLERAKQARNDEFYTIYKDIEDELVNYKEQFKDKVVYTNCDDPRFSNFFKYFYNNFNNLGLKKLIATHYNNNNEDTIFKYEVNNLNEGLIKTALKGDGDFSSYECLDIIKEANIVVSNPPFSIFRKYIQTIMDYDKKFLVIGNYNAITYRDIFNLIKDNKVWLGKNSPKRFLQPDGKTKNFGNIVWYTNIYNKEDIEEYINLSKTYKGNEDNYLKYDNYDIINVNKVNDIPYDYEGYMGVPITFIKKFNIKQFELLGIASPSRWVGYECYTKIKDENIYNRLIIRYRKENII